MRSLGVDVGAGYGTASTPGAERDSAERRDIPVHSLSPTGESITPCRTCAGARRITLPNPHWAPETPKEATASTGPHGRLMEPCPACTAITAPAALPRLARAVRGLIAVRPIDWNDSEDPELERAWREAEDALAMAGIDARDSSKMKQRTSSQ